MRAVQLDSYGGIDSLQVRDIPCPATGPGEVRVAVRAAGINPGEALIRSGILHELWPATFPCGQGSDLAGTVDELGEGVHDFRVHDEVLGFTENRCSQAEFAVIPANQLTRKPAALSWEAVGGLFVAGSTAYASVQAIELDEGETVVVAAAAGGVGSIAVQLAKRRGATVLGIAGPGNDDWLITHGVPPVNYGPDIAGRLREAAPHGGIDAFLDFFGDGYVALAVAEFGISPARINTVIDLAAAADFGVRTVGNADAANVEVLAELAALIAPNELEIPIAAAFVLDDVQAAYRLLEQRHTRGKIVRLP